MKNYIIGIQLIIVLPLLFLFFYAWPSCDDYAVLYQMSVDGKSVWEAVLNLYYLWGGRYSSLLCTTISPMAVSDLWFYRGFLLLIFLLLFLSVWWFWNSVLVIDRKFSIIYSLLFFILYLNVIPGIADSFYWFSGVITYTLPLVFLFFLSGCIINFRENSKLKALILFCVFFIIGFNEIAAFIAIVIGGVFLFSIRKSRFGVFEYFLILTILTGIGLLMLSPGNLTRMSLFPESNNLLNALVITLSSWIKFNVLHIQNIPLWLTAFLLFPFLKLIHFHNSLHKIIKLHPLVIIAIIQVLFFMLFFIPSWSMGLNPPLRVYNFLSPLWLIGFLWVLISLHSFLSVKLLSGFPVLKGLSLKVFIIFIVLSIFSNFIKVPDGEFIFGSNIMRSAYDLVFRAGDYKNAMHNREKIINNAKIQNNMNIKVPRLINPPGTIFFFDITSDPAHWANRYYASFYEVNSIHVIEPYNCKAGFQD